VITLYDNPFSPFARKVRLALRLKEIAYQTIDALALEEHDRLTAVNPRAEVPVLVDDGLVVANSSEIVAYLDDRYRDPSLMPESAVERVKARRWQRIADTVFDAILHDISLWTWPTHRRQDAPPDGLLAAGMADLAKLVQLLEDDLVPGAYVCDALSVADLAVFPHVTSLRLLGVGTVQYPKVEAWTARMRALPAVAEDLAYVRTAARETFGSHPSPYEGEKVIWRGDRIEWLFHHGFVEWWSREWYAGRAVVPSAL